MKFTVVFSQWAADGQAFAGGEHDSDNGDFDVAELAPFLPAADAAGAIVITDMSAEEIELLVPHSVQSQEDGEEANVAALAEANAAKDAAFKQHFEAALADAPDEDAASRAAHAALKSDPSWADGTWAEGNLVNFGIDVAEGVRRDTLALDGGQQEDVTTEVSG